jgi:hypothetical protein
VRNGSHGKPGKGRINSSMSALIRPLSVQTRLFPFLTLFGLRWTGRPPRRSHMNDYLAIYQIPA